MKLTFWGACRTVTGSMHLLEVGGRRILLDCGLYQGRRAEAYERNRNFSFDPASVDAVVLSHAHLDHCGNLPTLVKRGFRGTIYCTAATADLSRYLLQDSGHVQQSDCEFLNKKRRPGEPLAEPLYTLEDAIASLSHFVGVPYNRAFTVAPGVEVTFLEAGHILGSAQVVLALTENGRSLRLAFTGDLGRKAFPVTRDPEPLPLSDVLITESTYGNRLHSEVSDVQGALLAAVKRAAARGGKIVCPAFALGRTQGLVSILHDLFDQGKLPPIPIFVDSPLATNLTHVFTLHPECLDAETLAKMRGAGDPFGFARLTYVSSAEDSKKLNDRPGPFMVISSSGMCEAGRIIHHLKHSVEDPKNLILFVGFQAEHTLGRRLAEGAKTAKLYGVEHTVRAEVVRIDGLSAHADRDDLIASVRAAGGSPRVFVVHGEEAQALELAASLRRTGLARVDAPVRGESFVL
ncbi:MAG: MBL fold metallo-hydrolase [Planctomycetes bacterium]|nr:MBL fold metallo-hydrolase [Planctomycetota bacterium]